MRLTVFTPSHDPAYLDQAWFSLREQTHPDWEWVVLLNGDAIWSPPEPDPRVQVLRSETTGLVGAAKREACRHGTGEVLVELDHDDLLVPQCLGRIAEAFDAHPDASLVYSDFAQVNADGSSNITRFDHHYGWEYRAEGARLVCTALAPTPHNLAYIWYAPNHVRAFRRSCYERVGGYDAALEILDDQDLMTRLYLVGEFVHIPECLYLQRVHPKNTQAQPNINQQIQDGTVARYWQDIGDLTTAWAARSGLAVLDVSPQWAGGSEDPAMLGLADDNSVGLIYARELLQRLDDHGRFFADCWRALAPGGLLVTVTPSTDGRGAFQDPTHTSWWNENSFWYLTQQPLRDRVWPDVVMRWQTSGIRTTWWPNQIAYVEANLVAVKDGPRQGGPLL